MTTNSDPDATNPQEKHTLTPDQWRRVHELYQKAVTLEASEHDRFLHGECDDSAVRSEVLRQLYLSDSTLPQAQPPASSELEPTLAVAGSARPGGHGGELIGRYEVFGELGRGGMGIVYQARDPRLERVVALKVLPPAVSRDARHSARFEREAQLLARLQHPNIATIYSLETAPGLDFLTLEFVPGDTLRERLAEGSMSPQEAYSVSLQLARALEYAHEKNIVHRDLKPANIKITPTGEVKVLDFGLAKALDVMRSEPEPQLTEVGFVLGTPGYMSPEQLTGQPVDERADIWAFGCVLYECLTGVKAFAGRTSGERNQATLHAEPDWGALSPETSDPLRELLSRCLTKDVSRRLRCIAESKPILREATLETPKREVDLEGPLPAARSLAGRPRRRAAIPGVGYDGIRALLSALLQNTPGKPGSLYVLLGELGGGKSTLLSWLEEEANRFERRMLRGFATRSSGEPLKMFRDLFLDLLGISEIEHTGQSLRRVAEQRLRKYLRSDSPTTKYLLNTQFGEGAAPLQEGTLHYHWYRILVAASAKSPLLVLLEDLHDADLQSLALLSGLLERLRQHDLPIRFIATISASHPDADVEKERALAPFISENGLATEVFELKGLSREEVESLLRLKYPGLSYRDDMPWLPQAVYDRTAGHPAFVAEVLDELAEETNGDGIITKDEKGQWKLATILTYHELRSRLPVRYSQSVERRIARVPAAFRSALEYAAFLGVEIPVPVLHRLLADVEVLDAALDSLEEEGLIEPMDRELTRYRFTSQAAPPLVRLQTQKAGRRAAAKKRIEVARAAEAELGEAPEHAEWIGVLFSEAGQHAEAVPHLLRAVGARVAHGQYADAHALLRRIELVQIQAHVSPKEDILEYLLLKGKVLCMLGRLELAGAASQDALQLAKNLSHEENEVRSLVLLADIEIRKGSYDRASAFVLRALECEATNSNETLRFDAKNSLGIILIHQQSFEDAQALFRENLEVLRQERRLPQRREAQTLNNLGVCQFQLRHFDAAQECFRKTVEIARDLENLEYDTTARVWLANIDLLRGDLESAHRGYLHAAEVCRDIQNMRGLARSYFNLAQVYELLGKLDLARDSIRRGIQLFVKMGDSAREGLYRLFHAELLYTLGEVDECRHELALSKSLAGSPQPDLAVRRRLLELQLGSVPSESDLQPRPESDAGGMARARLLELRSSRALGREVPADIRAATRELCTQLTTADLTQHRCDLEVELALTNPDPAAGVRELGRLLEDTRGRAGIPVDRIYRALAALLPAGSDEARAASQDSLSARRERAQLITDPVLRRSFLSAYDPAPRK